jgi:hypothetical protein
VRAGTGHCDEEVVSGDQPLSMDRVLSVLPEASFESGKRSQKAIYFTVYVLSRCGLAEVTGVCTAAQTLCCSSAWILAMMLSDYRAPTSVSANCLSYRA